MNVLHLEHPRVLLTCRVQKRRPLTLQLNAAILATFASKTNIKKRLEPLTATESLHAILKSNLCCK